MSKLGRISAALGAVTLNVVLALIISSGTGAVAHERDEPRPEPVAHVVIETDAGSTSDLGCVFRLRNRAIVAVVLALMV